MALPPLPIASSTSQLGSGSSSISPSNNDGGSGVKASFHESEIGAPKPPSASGPREFYEDSKKHWTPKLVESSVSIDSDQPRQMSSNQSSANRSSRPVTGGRLDPIEVNNNNISSSGSSVMGGKHRIAGTSTSKNVESPPELVRRQKDSSPEMPRRSNSLGNRTAEAYYKHLERFKVPRTQSWMNLQTNKAQKTILKPLKLLSLGTQDKSSKWLFGNPWTVVEPKDPRVIMSGKYGHRPKTIHTHISGTGNESAESMEVTDLREVKSSRSRGRSRKNSSKIKSRSVWDLSSSPSGTSDLNMSPSKKSSLVRFTRSAKVAPLRPLPSPNTRKSFIKTRGNREVQGDEDSESDDPIDRHPPAFNRNLNPHHSYSKLIPSLRKKSDIINNTECDVMTIDHDQLMEVTTSADDETDMSLNVSLCPSLHKEDIGGLEMMTIDHDNLRKSVTPVMGFDEARDVLEDVFLDTLKSDDPKEEVKDKESEEDDDDEEEEPEMNPEEAAGVIEGAFMEFLAGEEEEEEEQRVREQEEREEKQKAAALLEGVYMDYLARGESISIEREDDDDNDMAKTNITEEEAAAVLEGVVIDYLAEQSDDESKVQETTEKESETVAETNTSVPVDKSLGEVVIRAQENEGRKKKGKSLKMKVKNTLSKLKNNGDKNYSKTEERVRSEKEEQNQGEEEQKKDKVKERSSRKGEGKSEKGKAVRKLKEEREKKNESKAKEKGEKVVVRIDSGVKRKHHDASPSKAGLEDSQRRVKSRNGYREGEEEEKENSHGNYLSKSLVDEEDFRKTPANHRRTISRSKRDNESSKSRTVSGSRQKSRDTSKGNDPGRSNRPRVRHSSEKDKSKTRPSVRDKDSKSSDRQRHVEDKNNVRASGSSRKDKSKSPIKTKGSSSSFKSRIERVVLKKDKNKKNKPAEVRANAAVELHSEEAQKTPENDLSLIKASNVVEQSVREVISEDNIEDREEEELEKRKNSEESNKEELVEKAKETLEEEIEKIDKNDKNEEEEERDSDSDDEETQAEIGEEEAAGILEGVFINYLEKIEDSDNLSSEEQAVRSDEATEMESKEGRDGYDDEEEEQPGGKRGKDTENIAIKDEEAGDKSGDRDEALSIDKSGAGSPKGDDNEPEEPDYQDILNSSGGDTKDESVDEASILTRRNSRQNHTAEFSSAVNQLVSKLQYRQLVNVTNDQTSAPDSIQPMAFNQKPNFNFESGATTSDSMPWNPFGNGSAATTTTVEIPFNPSSTKNDIFGGGIQMQLDGEVNGTSVSTEEDKEDADARHGEDIEDHPEEDEGASEGVKDGSNGTAEPFVFQAERTVPPFPTTPKPRRAALGKAAKRKNQR